MVFHFFDAIPDHSLVHVHHHDDHHVTPTAFFENGVNQPYKSYYFPVTDPAFKANVEFLRSGPLFPAATDKPEFSGPFKFGFLKHMDATQR